MDQIKALTAVIEKLQASNETILNKLKDANFDPVYITTEDLKERWCCKYSFVNAQMKEGLPVKKANNKKMLFRYTDILKWEEAQF